MFSADVVEISNMPYKCYMLRHLDAEDTGGITGGGLNPPLTQAGKEKAPGIRDKVEKLGISVVVQSPLRRCVETVDILFEGRDVEVITEPDYREIEHGVMEGTPSNERNKIWEAFYPVAKEEWQMKKENQGKELPLDFKFHIHPHQEKADQYLHPVDPKYYVYDSPVQAETLHQLEERVTKATVELVDKYRNRVTAVVTSNAALFSLIVRSQIDGNTVKLSKDGLYPHHFEQSLIPNGAIAEFDVYPDSGKIKFVQFR